MPNTFTPEQIAQILEAFFDTVGTRQYIGARYVPIFGRKDEDSIIWDNSAPYEPLTIVLYQGNSFTSRQYVPEGVDITNEQFWAQTSNYNAQIEQYRQETAQALQVAQQAETSINTIDTIIPTDSFAADNTVKDYIDNATKGLDETHCVDFYGADPTGVNDSSDGIAACIAANEGSAIYFNTGTYKISRTIETPHSASRRVSINFNYAKITPSAAMDCILDIGAIDPLDYGEAGSVRTYIVNALFENASSLSLCGVNIRKFYKDVCIENLNIREFVIGIRAYDSTGAPSDLQIDNCFIRYSNMANTESAGIVLNGTDNKISNTRIYGFHDSILDNAGSLYCYNVHNLPKFAGEYLTASEGASFIKTVGHARLMHCYCDTYPIFANVVGTGDIVMQNCEMYSYITQVDYMHLIEINYLAGYSGNIQLVGNKITPRESVNEPYRLVYVSPNMSGNTAALMSKLVLRDNIVSLSTSTYGYIKPGDMLNEFKSRAKNNYWQENNTENYLLLGCLVIPQTRNHYFKLDCTLMFSTPRKVTITGLFDRSVSGYVRGVYADTTGFPANIYYQYVNNESGKFDYVYIFIKAPSGALTTNYILDFVSDTGVFVPLNSGKLITPPANEDYTAPIDLDALLPLYENQ